MNRFYVDETGDVFLILHPKVAAYVNSNGVYALKEDGSKPVLVDIYSGEDLSSYRVYGIKVGNLQDMYLQRADWLPTLESVARYYDKYGKMPWHLRTLCRQNGWDVIPTRGYNIVIADETSNFFLRVAHDGTLETGSIHQTI